MPDCKQYGGITRAELGHLRKDLAAEGIVVPEGDDVTVKGPFKIELSATYDETKETLKICITKKTFLYSRLANLENRRYRNCALRGLNEK